MNPLNCCMNKNVPEIQLNTSDRCCNNSACNFLCCFSTRNGNLNKLDDKVNQISLETIECHSINITIKNPRKKIRKVKVKKESI